MCISCWRRPKYKLLHNIPEIRKGAIVEYDCDSGRYKVKNLSEVARYPLRPGSRFTFHVDSVCNDYWFEKIC